MAYLHTFGAYLPRRVVGNDELAARLGVEPDWIERMSGIRERRYAADGETLVDMAVEAGRNCVARAGVMTGDVGMIIVASGSAESRFPGPAAAVASRLGIDGIPALDVPMASAGSLFALSLAERYAEYLNYVLVIGAEKLSPIVLREGTEPGVAMLFGDGAGACLIGKYPPPEIGGARIVDSLLASDGAYANDLRLGWDGPLQMNGSSVILQASRKVPRAINTLLERNKWAPESVSTFLMHQANRNLLDRVAQTVGVAPERFYSNIDRYGNTSSASMLIAAAEWEKGREFGPGERVVFAAFGAGFHWGALLVEGLAEGEERPAPLGA